MGLDIRWIARARAASRNRTRSVRRSFCITAAISSFVVVAGVAPASAESYSYDSLGRLIAVNSDNGTTTTYAYDPAGNRTSTNTAAGSTHSPTANDDTLSLNYGVASASLDPRTNDTDPASLTLSVISIGQPGQGSATLSGNTVTYVAPTTPNPAGASDLLTYTIQNSAGMTASAVIHVALGAQPTPTPLSGSVSATTWNWYQDPSTTTADSPLVCSASGGASPYTYAWQRVSGNTAISATAASSASTSFTASFTGYTLYTAIWRCKVTDASSNTAYSPNVDVTMQRQNVGNQ